MGAQSYAFAAGAVHTREGGMVTRERMERLIHVDVMQDALKILQEMGYGQGETVGVDTDYEAWLKAKEEELVDFVGRISPDTAATQAFLLREDYISIKALYKQRTMGENLEDIVLARGTMANETLLQCVREQDYNQLGSTMKSALRALDAQAVVEPLVPRDIDVALDKAYFQDVQALMRKAKSRTVKRYFTDYADLTNLRAALRARTLRLGADVLQPQLVSGGMISSGQIMQVFDDPERAQVALIGRQMKKDLEEALVQYRQEGTLALYERVMSAHLLSMFKARQWTQGSVDPLIGYMLGMRQEIVSIRLCMVGIRNDFSAETLRERLGDLYV